MEFSLPFLFPKLWNGIYHSHSLSLKLEMEYSFPFPFPKFGNGICHSHSRSRSPKVIPAHPCHRPQQLLQVICSVSQAHKSQQTKKQIEQSTSISNTATFILQILNTQQTLDPLAMMPFLTEMYIMVHPLRIS